MISTDGLNTYNFRINKYGISGIGFYGQSSDNWSTKKVDCGVSRIRVLYEPGVASHLRRATNGSVVFTILRGDGVANTFEFIAG